MNAKMRSTHLRSWPWLSGGMSSLSHFFGQWCLPGAIQSLLPTSILTCPTALPQKAAQTAGKTRAALWTSAKIQLTHSTRRSDAQFTHDHPSTRKGEFLKNSDIMKRLGVFKGFCLWFSRGFFLRSWWESLCL